jgi:pimeloyl-ACP methyl ester carboxylesterase
MGGYVGLELLRRTGYVEKLILLNSNFWEDSQQKKIDRNRIINIVASNKDWFIREAIPNLFYQPIKSKRIIEYLCQEASNMSIEAIQGATLAMRDRESSEDLIKENFNKIKILQGQHDAVIPLELMLAKNNGICNLVVFPDSAHMSHEEVPELVVKEIIQFINIE